MYVYYKMNKQDKKKLELYEKFIKELKSINIESTNIENINNTDSLRESIIIEKDNSKKLRSDLTESFMVIENGKDLKELNKRDLDIILEQDSYAKYQNANYYCQKANGLYKIGYYALSIGKWFILL